MSGFRDGTWRRVMKCRFRHVGSLLSDGTQAALIMIGSARAGLPSSRFLADSGSKENFGILAGKAEKKNRRDGETAGKIEDQKFRRSEEQIKKRSEKMEAEKRLSVTGYLPLFDCLERIAFENISHFQKRDKNQSQIRLQLTTDNSLRTPN